MRVGKFFNIPIEKLEEAKRYFRDNAAKAVFLGRFVTLLRIFAGPMAGIVQMPYQNFLLCNFGGSDALGQYYCDCRFLSGSLNLLRADGSLDRGFWHYCLSFSLALVFSSQTLAACSGEIISLIVS